MTNDNRDDNEKTAEACLDYLERHGQVIDVGPAYYEEFINSNERKMEFLIKCIINYSVDLINKNVFNNKWEDDDIYSYIMDYLDSMAIGIIGINLENFTLCLRKPIGEPPSGETQRKIEEKIRNAKPLIKKVILENLEGKNGGFKG